MIVPVLVTLQPAEKRAPRSNVTLSLGDCQFSLQSSSLGAVGVGESDGTANVGDGDSVNWAPTSAEGSGVSVGPRIARGRGVGDDIGSRVAVGLGVSVVVGVPVGVGAGAVGAAHAATESARTAPAIAALMLVRCLRDP